MVAVTEIAESEPAESNRTAGIAMATRSPLFFLLSFLHSCPFFSSPHSSSSGWPRTSSTFFYCIITFIQLQSWRKLVSQGVSQSKEAGLQCHLLRNPFCALWLWLAQPGACTGRLVVPKFILAGHQHQTRCPQRSDLVRVDFSRRWPRSGIRRRHDSRPHAAKHHSRRPPKAHLALSR